MFWCRSEQAPASAAQFNCVDECGDKSLRPVLIAEGESCPVDILPWRVLVVGKASTITGVCVVFNFRHHPTFNRRFKISRAEISQSHIFKTRRERTQHFG